MISEPSIRGSAQKGTCAAYLQEQRHLPHLRLFVNTAAQWIGVRVSVASTDLPHRRRRGPARLPIAPKNIPCQDCVLKLNVSFYLHDAGAVQDTKKSQNTIIFFVKINRRELYFGSLVLFLTLVYMLSFLAGQGLITNEVTCHLSSGPMRLFPRADSPKVPCLHGARQGYSGLMYQPSRSCKRARADASDHCKLRQVYSRASAMKDARRALSEIW